MSKHSRPLENFVIALHNKGYTSGEIKLLWNNTVNYGRIYEIYKKHGIVPPSEPKTNKCATIGCPGFTKLYSRLYPMSYKYCPYCGKPLHLTRAYKHRIMTDAYGNKLE
jgi:hypothetical protein